MLRIVALLALLVTAAPPALARGHGRGHYVYHAPAHTAHRHESLNHWLKRLL